MTVFPRKLNRLLPVDQFIYVCSSVSLLLLGKQNCFNLSLPSVWSQTVVIPLKIFLFLHFFVLFFLLFSFLSRCWNWSIFVQLGGSWFRLMQIAEISSEFFKIVPCNWTFFSWFKKKIQTRSTEKMVRVCRSAHTSFWRGKTSAFKA